jgi:cell division transport system ATP-binding protein
MNFSDQPVITVKNVDIYQEDFLVLDNISFEIPKGEFYYLVGETGSGKSSLLKTLYRDLKLEKGSIQITGHYLNHIKEKEVPLLRRKLGIIFQDFQLFYDRTVFDNLHFVLKATGWSNKAKIKQRISEVLMRVGLEASTTKMPHQLSGGEQQRIVIARALLNEPSVLLADEPTGNLDPVVAADIMRIFEEINRSGTAIIMATHNHTFFTTFPHKQLICKDKKITIKN